MAIRGSKKARSIAQEDHVAALYDGVRSLSSGAADNDQGDVRTESELFECKYTGGPGEPIKRPKLLSDMEKVASEAWQEDREPVVAVRFFDPDSPLSDKSGYIDMTVRLQHNDVHRSRLIKDLSEELTLSTNLLKQVIDGRS